MPRREQRIVECYWSRCRESGGKEGSGEKIGPELISDARGKMICTEKKDLRAPKRKTRKG